MAKPAPKKVLSVAKTTLPSSRPNILRLEKFVRMFKDSVLDKQDIRYCFILGSGASITSGVESGAKLADWWLTEMHQDAQPKATPDKLQAWTEREFKNVPGFTWANRASFYGHIYNRRFPDNASGQTWLRKLMENKSPAFGYSVLARILSKTRHNLVITTNFDNLVHDALTALSCPRAFIAHSPGDARFLANHDNKPRIIKLHGDIDRETYNASSLIHDLADAWHEPLRHLLGAYTPIFIGYGGSDPGLMRFLNEEYQASDARPRPVWTYRVNPHALKTAPDPMNDPPGRLDTEFCLQFMDKQKAWWLPTPGFDELMVLLGHALDYPHGGREITSAAEEAAKTYQTSLTNALKAARTHEGSKWCDPLDEMTRMAEQALLGEVKRRRWSEWQEYINAAVNPAEEIARCEEAIGELPEEPRSHASLVWVLSDVNPSDSRIDGVLAEAKHLAATKCVAGEIEDIYVRNVEATHWRRQGKADEAAAAFTELVKLSQQTSGPEHPDTLGSRNNLANALKRQGKYAEAEVEHRTVLEIRQRVLGPEHPKTLGSRNNLASALQAQGKHVEAEAEHRAISEIRKRVLGPEHPETLISRNNFADALQAQGKHVEAEAEHRAVIEIRKCVLGPEHRDVFRSSHNLSLCLEARGKKPEALELARRAFEGWRKTLGESHPDTLEAQKHAAELEKAS